MRFSTTAKIQELNGVRCSGDEAAQPTVQPMLNHVILSFDLNKIPEGDVDSQTWLDSLYDAFMSQNFSSLPDGVRLWELVQTQAGECKANTDIHS